MMDFKEINYAVLTCKKYDDKDPTDRGKGGAVIAITKKTIGIRKYDISVDQSNGGKQNVGACTNRVLKVAGILMEGGM